MGKELFSLFFQRFVNRRRLLIMARNVAIFSTIARHTPKVTASSPLQQLPAVGYGQGGYGEGKYPAEMRQNIYLPIVNKKGG